MSPQDPQAAAFLAHIVAQVESNVQFLVSQNYLSQADASVFLNKLPEANPVGFPEPTPTRAAVAGRRVVPPPPPAPVVRSPAPLQARALWGYNEGGTERDDLSFAAGDIIEVVSTSNEDWWTGRVHGREGLFPSQYVEKIEHKEKAAYRPFGAAYQGTDTPPPVGGGLNSIGLQQDAGQEKKKGKFGNLGNTMANSAAGGVGFGAGAAIGGGLVRAIF
ncbi:SH3-domain-containing protein [Pluteus cervinus]|uniref:SH3-domain-containing protein n=1 Tax=Pluteus cervinus TaxID=181527 RepID=A0ACD3AKS5_9AGAR|nr:SH3-domain-containing protein [Pluteus cervinus]